ncbi:hypothetical protein JCM8097_001261 [Rhodosporidiobolus ruineniae]
MPVAQPALPAVPDYPTPGPHAQEVEQAHQLFRTELERKEDEWDYQGEREEIKLWQRTDPNDPDAVPTVKGECVVEGVPSEAFLSGVIQLPGMRKAWDARFETGHMIARYDRQSFAFYTAMLGFSVFVYGRDIVGVQRNYADETTGERLIVQTSVQEDELVPEQSGKTRATLTLSGWRLLPEGDDLRVTYIVNIKLNGAIPLPFVTKVASEIPLCTGRARDVFYEHGHAPYARLSAGAPEPAVVFQTESFSDVSAREYRCTITTGSQPGEAFEIRYDLKRMYRAEGGVQPPATIMSIQAAVQQIQDALQAGELIGSSIIPSTFTNAISVHTTYESFGNIQPGSTYTVDETQVEPSVSFQPSAEGPDAKYTILLVDPDAPSKEDPKMSPFLHFALADVVPNQAAGQTLVTYMGPAPPPGTGRHRYVFLVFRQPWDHLPELGVEPDSRAQFPLADFIKRNELELVGANYFFAENK